jgi:hypothetical protein
VPTVEHETHYGDRLFNWLFVVVGKKVKYVVLSSSETRNGPGIFHLNVAEAKTTYNEHDSVADGDSGYERSSNIVYLLQEKNLVKRKVVDAHTKGYKQATPLYKPENRKEMLEGHTTAFYGGLGHASMLGFQTVEVYLGRFFDPLTLNEKNAIALNMLVSFGKWFQDTPVTSVEAVVICYQERGGILDDLMEEAKLRLQGIR